MAWIQELTAQPALAALIGSAVLMAALVALLVYMMTRDRRLAARLNEVEQDLGGLFQESRIDGETQARRSREELSTNLRGMGDSVSRLMNDMARTQQGQLDAFAGQMRDMQRVDEGRMDDMRRAVESRLMAYEGRMDKIGDLLDAKLDKTDERLEKMRRTVESQMAGLQAENNRRLDDMRAAVNERLGTALESRLGDSFRAVSARLDQVYEGLGEIDRLASGVGELKRVLTQVRARGVVGEVQLDALLSQVLSTDQYLLRARVRPDGPAVDASVRIPSPRGGDEALLPIDAGFPTGVYQAFVEALDTADQATADRLAHDLTAAIEERAAFVSANFIEVPRTTAFAVLFLPIEGLYAEALRKPGLPERLQRELGVTLAGPATLTALLNSLQMGLRAIQLEKRSGEVWALLSAVRGEFAEFADALARTQKRIRQAGESIEDVSRRSQAITKQLRGVKRLDEVQPAEIGEGDGEYGSANWD
ncbi:MAG: DNA recombination protein RmuC [Clostridiales bacterium]|nr:DNA recombination protein RmuC [Clostridiales bacterium]